MSQITIVVQNKCGVDRVYFLFVKAPEVSGGSKVFSSVYITAPPIQSGTGRAKFICKKDFFALCGTSPGEALDRNVQIITTDWSIAKINQDGKKGSSFTMTGAGNGAVFDNALFKQDCNQPGSFSIESTNFMWGNGGKCDIVSCSTCVIYP